MASTPNVQQVWDELHTLWPDVGTMGICNCRKMRGSHHWSQHAWCNAWDITSPTSVGPRTRYNLRHMAYLDAVYAYLVKHRERLGIRFILWRRSSHWNHIHVDFYPYGMNLPPCAGGFLKVKYADGSVGYSWEEQEEDMKVTLTPERIRAASAAGWFGGDPEYYINADGTVNQVRVDQEGLEQAIYDGFFDAMAEVETKVGATAAEAIAAFKNADVALREMGLINARLADAGEALR